MNKITAPEVVEWAKQFLAKTETEITAQEKKEQQKYAILIQNPNDKILLSKLLDESSQIRDNKKLAQRMKILIERYGVPEFFSSTDAFLMKLFTTFGYWFDFIAVPIFKKELRAQTSNVIIDEKASILNKHLGARRSQQIGQNVNLLGEVVLGDGEANHRYEHYLEALKNPQINYISIKISGIYAQINALNYAQNKIELCERLTRIYRQAIDYPYTNEKGEKTAKFVNLDMEEYKDTELTLEVFISVLSLPQFKNYYAGIVIQAYLPDAWNFQTELLEFAKKRVADGGSPLKMRLVKGANLQMESIISSIKGWENPILDTKIKVDANHLHILERSLEPENASVIHVGVATHNFFSIGYSYLLCQKNGVEEFVTYEMLEGMANYLPRVMRSLGKQIILYTPVVKDEHFLNAVSYLVRRLDENTGTDNFLSYSFNLKPDSEHWNFLKNQFMEAYAMKDSVDIKPKRTQNRNTEHSLSQLVPIYREVIGKTRNAEHETLNTKRETFKNEPDTNFDLKPNRLWADEIRKNWMKTTTDKPYQIPIQIGDKEIISQKKYKYLDRCQEEEICVCEASLSNLEQVKEIVNVAEKDTSKWRKTTIDERNLILHKTADNLCNKRGHLIGSMSAITGKTFMEGDVEVSEAIDFCRYYPLSFKKFEVLKSISITPKGIILVIPPWNFPTAIPVGGVAAALAGGNTVILKPATVAFPIAWEFAKCFWEAGVPKDALQVVCTDGREPLNYLTAHPSIQHIILTGGTDTAFRLLENNPTCPLSAETGGKNAIIVTSSADRDHAIQNIITSAFSNAGQKCSACSLLILDKKIFNDNDFKTKMIDAVTSLHTGSVWNGGNYVGPMITAENKDLLHAINHLEEGEWWLVKPEFVDKKHFMLKPCVKWGVKPGSFSFNTELFAPMLSVVCMDNLEHGIQLANNSEFGLTAGLQSLDECEQKLWKNSIEAGNLYINRGITGAIVNRQPFGGMKRSAFGGGIKAGGPNYVSCFVNINNTSYFKELEVSGKLGEFKSMAETLRNDDRKKYEYAIESYFKNYKEVFSVEKDINNLMGEQNTFRYLPLKNILFRIQSTDELTDILMVLAAANIACTPLIISISSDHKHYDALKMTINAEIILQTEYEFIESMEKYERIRTCTSELSIEIYKKAAKLGKYIATQKPLMEGRLELLHYLKEQSIAFEYHRYGSITEKPE
ncbi:MAG: bifunctional proline dehydrogenase/L-glutamate gamma-semialdehyde dehydrogenase [Paludibacter sp.]|nr:bifunctional proline dehydrogenase/L-glutamate gamma-semialdehyde dehydrogenase [Paludibacter sp.]